MGKIRMFEDFVPVGFGTNNLTSFAASGRNINTGYNMDAFVGPALDETCNRVAEQAYAHEANDNPEHTAEGYIKEAKDLINKRIDEACEAYGATNEGTINEGTDIGSWNQGGIKGNENVLITTFAGPKDIEDFGLGRKCMQINVGRSYVQLNPADIVELKDLLKNYKV